MSNTARKTYSLPRGHAAWVKAEAERLGIYESSVVRMALDAFMEQVPVDVSLFNEARMAAKAELFEAVGYALHRMQQDLEG
jgi:hypothetical protein